VELCSKAFHERVVAVSQGAVVKLPVANLKEGDMEFEEIDLAVVMDVVCRQQAEPGRRVSCWTVDPVYCH
jgi:hypothetical protein